MKNEIIIDGVKYLRVDADKKVITELTDEQLRALRGLIYGGFAAIVACVVVAIDNEKI